MAYDKKSIRVVAGGLNLLLPGDQIDDSEAQELTNFSTDSFGALRSRRGHSLRYSVGSEVVNMIRSMGNLWVAAGGNVYKDGAVIISGVSSDRVGLVGFRDFIWAMSEADQRKSNGTNDWDWIPEAPTAKATIAPAATVETEVVNLSGGFTVDPAGDENYDEGVLEIHGQRNETYTAVKDVSLDLMTGFSLDDVFKLRVWCRKWKRIDRVVFELDCNDGTFTNDYYTAQMLKSDINAGTKEEVTFYLRKRPQNVDIAVKDKKRYGWLDRIGSTPEKDYRSIVKVRIKVDFDDTTKIRFQEWTLVGDSDNTLEGDDFKLFYTHTTAAGHESNPSPISDPITVNRTGIDVSDMEVSADPQVTGKNVYLTGGTLQAVYRVNKNTPIVGTTYEIRKTDDDLSNDNLQLEDDHSNPPAVSGAIGPYYGRVIAFGNRRYYWSHVNRPYAFAFPDDISGGDWNSVEEGVGELLAATMRPGVLFFYGTKNIAIVQGDPGFDSAVHASAIEQGIRSSGGVVKTPRGDVANLSEGIYVCNGDSAELISKKIERVFKDSPAFDPTKAAIGFRNDVAWVSDGTATYKFDFLTQRWFKDSRLFSRFYSDDDALVGATLAGAVLDLEEGFTDGGAAIPVAFKSKAYDCGILDNEKTFEDFTIWADTGGALLTIAAILNDGQDDEFAVTLGTISSTSKERFVLRFNPNPADIPASDADAIRARNCAIRITGSVSAECVIYEMALNYYVEAREAKSFDSDEKDFGTRKVKEIRQVYVDLHSPAAAQFILQTDQPGFAMATRDSSHSFAASTTRRGDTYVFANDYLAHNARFLLSGEDFRLSGMRALIRIIGTLIHGTKSEFYDSDVIDLGEERVKLYKFIEAEYATTGTAQLQIFTELPSGAQAEVTGSPFTLTGTGGLTTAHIQTRLIRLRGNAKGRLIRAKITPTGDFRLEALRFFFKLVGLPNATPWGWASFPVEATGPAQWSDVFIEPDVTG